MVSSGVCYLRRTSNLTYRGRFVCLIVLAVEQHPQCPFIFAANRDERHDRPTRQAQFWEDAPELLAGRDEVAGGTWCGVTRTGRFGAVSNFREPGAYRPDARSRGELVREFLMDDRGSLEFLEDLQEKDSDYNGFNLLTGDLSRPSIGYYSNRGGGPEQVPPGFHGISNHLLNTPWPKVGWSKKRLARIVAESGSEPPDTEALFDMLRSTDRPPDEDLPETGLDLEVERLVSAPFIIHPTYGTRSSTVITVDADGTLRFTEWSYNSSGTVVDTTEFAFPLS